MGPDHLCLEETIHLLESQRQAKTLTACLDFSKEWFSQAQIKIRSGLATIHLLSFHRTSLLSFQKKKKTMLRWKKVLNRNGQAYKTTTKKTKGQLAEGNDLCGWISFQPAVLGLRFLV